MGLTRLAGLTGLMGLMGWTKDPKKSINKGVMIFTILRTVSFFLELFLFRLNVPVNAQTAPKLLARNANNAKAETNACTRNV